MSIEVVVSKCETTTPTCKESLQVGVVRCPVCGKEFVKAKYNQAYCSGKCQIHANHLRWKETRRMKAAKRVFTCCVCGKQFTPVHGAQKCCSPGCMIINHRDKARRYRAEQYAKMKAANPAERVVRKCELCGKEFTVGRMKQQRFCSTVCNRRAYRIKHGAVPRTATVIDRAQLRREKLMQEVIDAQRGPIDELYEKSKNWTKEQRDFAKARYMKIHFGK